MQLMDAAAPTCDAWLSMVSLEENHDDGLNRNISKHIGDIDRGTPDCGFYQKDRRHRRRRSAGEEREKGEGEKSMQGWC